MHVHTPITVRYGETDMMGVVYHANYLLYLEDARIDFLEAVGFSYNERIEQQGYMSPVYRQQVFRADDAAGTDEAGEPLLREGATPLVDALVTLCVVERDTFRPVSLKRTFPDLYARYNELAEEA